MKHVDIRFIPENLKTFGNVNINLIKMQERRVWDLGLWFSKPEL